MSIDIKRDRSKDIQLTSPCLTRIDTYQEINSKIYRQIQSQKNNIKKEKSNKNLYSRK